VLKSLHRELAEASEKEGVSLNQFINVALAKAAGSYSTSEKDIYQQANFSAVYQRGLSEKT